MEASQAAVLRRIPLFGGIDAAIVELVLSRSESVRVPGGEPFFREDEPAQSMFVLEEGRVGVLKSWEGRDVLLGRLAVGDCFGEMSLIDMRPRSATVQALEDSSALEITGATLHAVYRANLEQFTLIQMNMGREVSRRLRMADQLLLRTRIEGNLDDTEYRFGAS